MDVRGYPTGPIDAKGAFTSEIDLPPIIKPGSLNTLAEADRPHLVDLGAFSTAQESAMADASARSTWFRPKTVFALIAAMAIYVLYHNERFLIDSTHPVWQHYEPFKWWLLPHGLAGACALILAPLQFWDRLRLRFTTLHRVIGSTYVTVVFIFAPLGVYIQYLDEAQGATRSFTIATMIDAALAMITTGIALVFALERKFPPHRQWMTRSYAVALVFLQVRIILGLTGLDEPFNWAITETVVWSCVAVAILIGDLANQWYELASARPRPVRMQVRTAPLATPAE